ncbi:MAG: 3-demethylubiquinone-9 3-O-methyltransferase [Proteobacteria bacterium]|nr:MAG: 3-demethylubiquinone-9 3-O-methyltransferase [Pseudomonadota bacterium]
MSEAIINNAFYDDLDERWYNDDGHIIGLLKAESRLKTIYVKEIFSREKVATRCKILDIGCGAGLISNELAKDGFEIHGIDQSASSVEVAKRHAARNSNVTYVAGDAFALPYEDKSFDVVMLLDFLEHVTDPGAAIKEATRVLNPGGIILFYTFNRTWIAGLLAVKAVEFIAKDCPKNFHLLSMFIKPVELKQMLRNAGSDFVEFRGLRPVIFHKPFFASIFQRKVAKGFDFKFTNNLSLGYMGYGIKSAH